MCWSSLLSTGYGQQLDGSASIISTRPGGLHPLSPAASGAAARQGSIANPVAQALSNAAFTPAAAAKGIAAQSKQVKPRLSPAAPITTIADPADGTDPYIVAQAQTLGNSAMAIFAFVRDQVGFDVYAGSLRGARGTLWTNAGNSLDRASLLIALLRAAGFAAQYVQGTLSGAQARQILQQMFAHPPLGVLGCIPAGTALADPVNDPTLTSTLQQHFWVQYSSGGGSFQNADPSFSGSQLGQAFGTPQTTFTTVPDSLQNTVSIELDAEVYNQAEALFGGNGLGTTPVLNATFATSETVGRPLAIGHLVSSSSISSVLSEQTNTYTPYVSYGNISDSSQDTVVTGTQYQEEFTSFPLGTTVVTGVFLTFVVTDSNGNIQTFNKTLFDRIGYAARQNGSSVSVSVTASGAPSISPLDITVVDILASLQNLSQAQSFGTTLASIQPQLGALVAEVATPSAPPTAQQISAMGRLATLSTQATITMGRAVAGAFAVRSDAMDNATVSEAYVKAFFNSPRLILVTNHITPGAGSQTITQELDTLKDDKASSIPLPGNNQSASISYNILRGTFDSIVESQVYQILTQNYAAQSGVTYVTGGSVADIFAAAQAQGIGTILLSPANAGELNNLPISADAQARISNALSANLLAFAPVAPVAINAANMYGWYEYDPTTGATESVGGDGGASGYRGICRWSAAR